MLTERLKSPSLFVVCGDQSLATMAMEQSPSSHDTNFVVRRAFSADEAHSMIFKLVEEEQWRPAIDDLNLYYNADPSGFYIGELNGKPIGGVTLFKYGDAFAFFHHFVVQKEYRGSGFGKSMFKQVYEAIPSSCNVGLDVVKDVIPSYRKKGFQEAHHLSQVMVDIAASSAKLQKFTVVDIAIQSAKQVNFDKLSAYDDAAFGAPHKRFLIGLLQSPNTITLGAIDTAGKVVGFVAARKTVIEEEGWKIGPLYADNDQIVRAILKEVLKEMNKDSPERKVATLVLGMDLHPGTKALAKELNAITLLDMVRMYTKGPLDFAKDKVYSFTN